MAPPIFAILFAVVVIAVLLAVAVWAIRAGLWTRETTQGSDPAREGRRRRRRRPEHVEVEDSSDARFFGT